MMWVSKWRYEVSRKPSRKGIWKLKTGGYLVQARVVNPKTGKRSFAMKILPHASLEEAQSARDVMRGSLKERHAGRTRRKMLWSEYAASLFERKVLRGDIKSAKSRERWEDTLTHHLLPAFGQFYCHDLRFADIEVWKDRIAKTFKAGEYAPTTANGWLSILKVVCRAMTAELELPRNPTDGISSFDTSTHHTYTDEEPNALSPEWATKFLAAMEERWPQHYAMTLLGFVTGWRPSSMRPLRRLGPSSDVDWVAGLVRLRRSQTMGDEVMEKTKTGKSQSIHLDAETMATLRAHVDSLTGPMAKSDLLFPSETGGFRSKSVLDKPFRDVAKAIQLPVHLTPRGMRRTFQDLARHARVAGLITRAISGHSTERMQEHYSTVDRGEIKRGLGKISKLIRSGGVPTRKAVKKAVKGRKRA